jgi:GDPmannose 4,6-dehydratase
MKKALITGVTGQDGAYLSKYLLDLGYFIYGAIRRSSNLNKERFDYFKLLDNKNFKLIELDITDSASLHNFFKEYQVSEVYNLAAQSFVGLSFSQPILTANITGLGPLYLLEAIRQSNREIKFYQASSSELYGKVIETPQNENTEFHPRSPYGVAKLFAHWSSINYRESYDMFTANGILFNHESPIRGYEFVTRKITHAVAKIKNGLMDQIELGNLNAKRDWGFAGDYVKMMHKMLQHDTADDFVIATGITTTVREFVTMAFNAAGIQIKFEGSGINESGYDSVSGRQILKISPEFFRPAEVDLLLGNPAKAKKTLGWQPETSVKKLVEMMVDYDLGLVECKKIS